MPSPLHYTTVPDNCPELRLCTQCGTDWWGMYQAEGKCFRCRKPGAPRPPWQQTSPEKEKQP